MTNPGLLPDLDRDRAGKIAAEALTGTDDGELFLEYRQSEALVFDDGQLKNASFDTSEGFGLRATMGETTGYAHSSEVSEEALKRAGETVRSIGQTGGSLALPPQKTNQKRYTDRNPIDELPFARKVALLTEADAFARSLDPRIKQVSISLSGEWQFVEVVRPDGFVGRDMRPLVRFNVSVVTAEGSRQESGSHGYGGRAGYSESPERRTLAVCGARGVAAKPGVAQRSCRAGRRNGRCAWRRDGQASCSMRRSGTAWRVTSTARKPVSSPN